MKYKLKYRFPLLLVLVIVACIMFTGCEPSTTQENPDTSFLDEQVPEPVRNLVISYLHDEHISDGTVYLAIDSPDVPQVGDFRIDSIVYSGEAQLHESTGIAYQVENSRYHFMRKDANDEGAYSWYAGQSFYIVLERSDYDDSWEGVLGMDYTGRDKKIEDVIVEVAYNLMDIEVSLKLDGYPQYVGPLTAPIFFNEEPEREILKEHEPIYNEGDYWLRLSYKDLSATCYYNAQEDTIRINNIETTRTDVATHRGVRIGMTRDEVLSTYPSIYDTQHWGYEGDYLWYCNNDEGWGAALLLWFEDDVVTKIQLINMFN